MNEQKSPHMGLDPEDFDGHTIDELSDYLDAGRSPADPAIDESPGALIALSALERIRALTAALLEADTAAEPDADDRWVQGILGHIALEARAGRRIPIAAAVTGADLGITEGAVRGVIRAAEKSVRGALVGRCRLDGDVTVQGEPIRVQVEVSVAYGEPVPTVAAQLREEISARLTAHTTLNVSAIDITVHGIHQFPEASGGES